MRPFLLFSFFTDLNIRNILSCSKLTQPVMNKRFLIVSALVLLTSSSWAQLKGGLKAGLNAAKQKWEVDISGLGSGSDSYKGVNFHVGGYLIHNFTDVVSFQPELLYNSLKVDLDGQDITMNYLSMPLMLGYGVENNKLIF